MKLAMALTVLMFASASQAAISRNFDCTDGAGINISWELRPNVEMQKYDRLYGAITVSINEVSKSVMPGKYVVGKDASISLTNFDDGDHVSVKASNLIKDDGDEQFFSGTATISIRSENNSKIQRKVKVTCSSFGEA